MTARRVLVLALVSLTACVSGTDYTNPPPVPDSGPIQWTDGGGPDSGVPDSGVPDAGQPHFDAGTHDAGTVIIGEWNIEFFASDAGGPTEEGLQLANVTTVMGQNNADIWGMEEVSNDAAFAQVIANLRNQWGEDYDYVLGDDPGIGNAYTGQGGSWGQKQGVVWRKSIATRIDAQLVDKPTYVGTSTQIDSSWRTTFVSREPLEVHLQLNTPSGLRDVWFLVVHFKANTGTSTEKQAAYNTRIQASFDVKTYLDQYHPNDAVVVVGDWNDDLDVSIWDNSSPTPFQNFLSDTADYEFPCQTVDASNAGTTISFSNAIDHHLISNELFSNYVTDSFFIEHPSISGYSSNNTSDHYPTFATYQFP